MRVLVSPGSKHGGTAEIGRAIARQLRDEGIDVDVAQPDQLHDLAPYTGLVIGSALYMGRWLPASRAFIDDYADVIRRLPTWLFSSGPVGESQPDEPIPADAVNRLLETTGALEHHLFGGRLELARLSRTDRFVARWVGAEDGDDRDWEDIAAWASHIAAELRRLVDAPTATDS